MLRPIFDDLGRVNLSRAEMLAEAEQAVATLIERSRMRVAPSNDGAEIDAAIAAARARAKRPARALGLSRRRAARGALTVL